MSETRVEPATVAHRPRVVETVVSAFRDDPAFRWFFRDPAAFDRHSTAFAGYLFDGRVDAGTVWVADGGSAVSMWDAPGGWTDAPLDLPRDVRDRLDRYSGIVHRLLPAADHWYLGVLATHPQHAGRRLGRAVMTPGVRRAAAAGTTRLPGDGEPGQRGHLRPGGLDGRDRDVRRRPPGLGDVPVGQSRRATVSRRGSTYRAVIVSTPVPRLPLPIL